MPRHYMIDIETWDTAPTAVIRAIAIVEFDPDGWAHEEMVVMDCRHTVDEQVQAGRTTSAETAAWWAKQEVRLGALLTRRNHYDRAGVYEPGTLTPPSLEEVVGTVAGFLWPGDDDIRVWSRGHFDIAILEHLLASQGQGIPWRYSQVRDVRTLDELVPPVEAEFPHHPFSDCLAQIQQVCAAMALAPKTDPNTTTPQEQAA
jgi:hypothetical protein